jgi:hypothetical protein
MEALAYFPLHIHVFSTSGMGKTKTEIGEITEDDINVYRGINVVAGCLRNYKVIKTCCYEPSVKRLLNNSKSTGFKLHIRIEDIKMSLHCCKLEMRVSSKQDDMYKTMDLKPGEDSVLDLKECPDTLGQLTLLKGAEKIGKANFNYSSGLERSSVVVFKTKHCDEVTVKFKTFFVKFSPEEDVTSYHPKNLIGHRGCRMNYGNSKEINAESLPENSTRSFREAIRRGAKWVELDVQVTKDEVPVIHHDFYVKTGMSNTPLFNLSKDEFLGSGCNFKVQDG